MKRLGKGALDGGSGGSANIGDDMSGVLSNKGPGVEAGVNPGGEGIAGGPTAIAAPDEDAGKNPGGCTIGREPELPINDCELPKVEMPGGDTA